MLPPENLLEKVFFKGIVLQEPGKQQFNFKRKQADGREQQCGKRNQPHLHWRIPGKIRERATMDTPLKVGVKRETKIRFVKGIRKLDP